MVGQQEVLVLRWTGDWHHLDFCHERFRNDALFFRTQGVNYSWGKCLLVLLFNVPD